MTVPRQDESDAGPAWWVLVGPTASGKSAVALELAARHPVEIVSVDSMQVYVGMDIGTAKPAPEERASVPHHMVDVLDPGQPCNVARFCAMAAEAAAGIVARGGRPLVVGGSPLYLKGLLWGLMDAPGRSPALRRRLTRECERLGPGPLHERLAMLDPQTAEQIHPNDVQRLVRALEVCELTGEPLSGRGGQFAGKPVVRHVMVGLRRPREELYRRIDRRVERMMERGLLREVAALRERLGPQSRQALGYKELVAHLEGGVTLAEAVELIKRRTRRYAKHQLTWFRHFPQVRWVDARAGTEPRDLAETCLGLFPGPA